MVSFYFVEAFLGLDAEYDKVAILVIGLNNE
jgi:hypothetical protein